MLVHNGIIANDKDLAKKYGMDQLIGEIDTRVLTEVISSQCSNEQEAAELLFSIASSLLEPYIAPTHRIVTAMTEKMSAL
jgi:glucosamine 6-phosphate synthetase-like amidotransferase/phosphosugar isomerase protein